MKLRLVHLVAAAVIVAILLPTSTGCSQTNSESPAQAKPEPIPVVPSLPPPEPEPTPPSVVQPEPAPEPEVEPEPVARTERVDVVFFHRTKQCHSCEYAETHVQSTLEQYFADELASGLVTSQSINMDLPENTAITEKYAAYASQLFITAVKGDEEVTEDVLGFWDYIDNDDGFSDFIVGKVNDALASID